MCGSGGEGMTRQRAGQVGFWTSVCPLSAKVKLSKTEVCCCRHQVTAVVSDSVRPHRRQPTRLPHPWDSPGKNTGVGCHFLLQCMKVKSESEAAQSCQTLLDPMEPTRLLCPWGFPGKRTVRTLECPQSHRGLTTTLRLVLGGEQQGQGGETKEGGGEKAVPQGPSMTLGHRVLDSQKGQGLRLGRILF